MENKKIQIARKAWQQDKKGGPKGRVKGLSLISEYHEIAARKTLLARQNKERSSGSLASGCVKGGERQLRNQRRKGAASFQVR